jgi:hypothetical protein
MPHDPARPSIRDPRFARMCDLIRLSDMARLNPARVDELLDRCADPIVETRNDQPCEPRDGTPA